MPQQITVTLEDGAAITVSPANAEINRKVAPVAEESTNLMRMQKQLREMIATGESLPPLNTMQMPDLINVLQGMLSAIIHLSRVTLGDLESSGPA